MKNLIFLLTLLLVLTGCGREAVITAPEPEPEPPVSQEPAPPETPQTETPAPPSNPTVEEPSENPPVLEVPALPELPQPVYCWYDTAVAADGSVILQVPDHLLTPVRDAVTGDLRGILSSPTNISWATVYDGFYDLSGQPIVEAQGLMGFQCFGDLFWQGLPGGITVHRLSDGTEVDSGLLSVRPAGPYLALQPSFWNSACRLVNETGETVLELERGFRLEQVFTDGGQTWLAMAKDGQVNLVDLEGKVLLGRFYHEIRTISHGCAVVRDGQTWLAVNLTSGETIFQWNKPFTMTKHGVLAQTDQGWQLLDTQGSALSELVLTDAYVYEDLILGQIRKDNGHETLLLSSAGTLLAELPTELMHVEPLSENLVFYAVVTGEEYYSQKGYLVDLATGRETLITTGAQLQMELIQTTGGPMLLCQNSEGAQLLLIDGTLARQDLPPCSYESDIFTCGDGLFCLDGRWLYEAPADNPS